MNVTSRAPIRTSSLAFIALATSTVLAALCWLPTPALAQDMAAFLSMELELERRLLADDLRQYAEARERQVTRGERVDELLGEVDLQFEQGTVILGELEAQERDIVAAQEALSATLRETERLRLRIYDRLRRTGLLEQALERQDGPHLGLDPLTGRWRLEIDPGDIEGVFTLRLDGTMVRGSYSIDDGGSGGLRPGTLPPSSGAFAALVEPTSRGSLRGTYAGGVLRLERIDAVRGLHSTFEGTVDPVRRQLRGTWTAVDLSTGGPGGGEWEAQMIDPDDGVSAADADRFDADGNDLFEDDPIDADSFDDPR